MYQIHTRSEYLSSESRHLFYCSFAQLLHYIHYTYLNILRHEREEQIKNIPRVKCNLFKCDPWGPCRDEFKHYIRIIITRAWTSGSCVKQQCAVRLSISLLATRLLS